MAIRNTKETTRKKLSKVDPVVPQGEFLVTVYINGKVYSKRTNNIAMTLLSLPKEKITNKVKIVVEKGNLKAERDLFVYPARRLFSMALATEFFAKNIIQRLK